MHILKGTVLRWLKIISHGLLSRPSLVAFFSALALVAFATAGSLTPSSSPASTMNTLEELFDSIAGTFDSSAIVADQDGSLIEHLKFIEENMGSSGVASDSLDFDEFVDAMTLDADLAVASSGFDTSWHGDFFHNDGNVGIASTSFTTKLAVEGTTRLSGHVSVGTHGGIDQNLYYNSLGLTNSAALATNEIVTTAATDNVFGGVSSLRVNLSGASSTFFVGQGTSVEVAATHTGTLDDVYGTESLVVNNSNATLVEAFGVAGGVQNFGTTGNITSAYSFYGAPQHFGGGTITNDYVFFADAPIGGGTITNQYGLYVNNQVAAGVTNAWNIFSVGANSRNHMAGRLGIGTTTPTQELHIASASDGNLFRLVDSDGDCTVNPEAATTFTCSSDRRLKSDIEDTSPILDRFLDFRIRDFTMNSSGDRMSGVVAQEVQKTWPEMVSMGASGYLMVDSPNPWLLVKAIQELNGRIDSLASEGPLEIGEDEPLFRGLVKYLRRTVLSVRGLVTEEIQTDRICVGSTCVTEEQFQAVFGK